MPSEPYEYEYFNVTFPYQDVAHVEINRAEKLNAFIEIMWLNLAKIIDRLSHDSDVRAIVISGAGDKAFTAGLDVRAASQGSTLGGAAKDAARNANNIRRHILEFQACLTALEKCEKPIISILHGFSYGLAIDLTSATDIRLCASTTRLCVKEVDIGIAADVGTLTRLPKVVGSFSWVKDVCLTAREFGAEEALRVGFVSGIYADKKAALERGFELGKLIAAKSPIAVLGTKDILNWSRERPIEDGLRYTAVWNSAMLQTQDVKDAMMAGLEKRKPTFSKL